MTSPWQTNLGKNKKNAIIRS